MGIDLFSSLAGSAFTPSRLLAQPQPGSVFSDTVTAPVGVGLSTPVAPNSVVGSLGCFELAVSGGLSPLKGVTVSIASALVSLSQASTLVGPFTPTLPMN